MHRLIEILEDRRLFSALTADFTNLGGPLQKPGLGSLFAVTAQNGGPDLGLLKGSTLNTSVPADKAGVTSTSPFTLANVAPILRKAGIKTFVRYADMLSGFPYQWVSLADWDSKVQGETKAISAGFKDVVRAVAPFNEPDNTFQGAFLTDPALPSGTYDQKVNWLWTHTVQEIKAIDAAIPIMGPNYVNYYPALDSSTQARMKAFLQNAKSTNTVPDIVGWHQLYSPAINSATGTVAAYRSLEASLGLPKLPISIEEYGYNNGQFAGVPSAMIPWWAEYERDGVSYASAGVYDNGGTLGNLVDYFQESNPQPNAGWWAANWYMNMSGASVSTTSAATRYAGAYEGIASYNAASRTGTVLLGGPDDQATINLKGVGKLIGGSVRVQLLDVRWTQDTNEPNSTIEHGGDPVYAPTTVLNNVYTPGASGDIAVNFHLQNLHGYELLITPATADTTPRYEAENAVLTNATVTASAGRSNGAYVTGMTQAGSAAQFTAVVPYDGAYTMTVGYGAGAAASQKLTVDSGAATAVPYAASPAGVITRVVNLKAGVNTIVFSYLSGTADLDYVSFAPIVQTKYEAEAGVRDGGVTYTNGPLASGGGYVGDLGPGDALTFNVTVPATGFYDMNVRYAAGDGADTQNVTVGGASEGAIAYPQTAVNAAVDLRTTTKLLALKAGLNVVRLTAGSGDPSVDFVDIQPDTHRYEAETATFTDANGGHFPNAYTYSFYDFVGGINNADSSVAFNVEAPAAGQYTVQVAYGNGGGDATDAVTVDGKATGSVSLPKTAGYLGSLGPAGQALATVSVALAQGQNTITLNKLTNYAELNYIRLVYTGAAAVAPASRATPKRGVPVTIAAAVPSVVPVPKASTAPRPAASVASLLLKDDASALS